MAVVRIVEVTSGDRDVDLHSMDGNGAGDELRSLYDWLLNEPEVRRNARVSLVSDEPRGGHMGAALEAVKLVVDSGFGALNLALAYAAWRANRPARPRVTIERDGTTVTLTDSDPERIDKIVRVIGTERARDT